MSHPTSDLSPVHEEPGAASRHDESGSTDVRDDVESLNWLIEISPVTEHQRRSSEAIATVTNARFGARGFTGPPGSVSWPALLAAGIYTQGDPPELLLGPIWTTVHLHAARDWRESITIDLRAGVVSCQWFDSASGESVALRRFLSAADDGIGVQVLDGPVGAIVMSEPIVGPDEQCDVTMTRLVVDGAEVMTIGTARGEAVAVAGHDDVVDHRGARTIERIVGMHVADARSAPRLARQRLASARSMGVDELERRHRREWGRRWDRAGTWLPERPDLERAVRFATSQLLGLGSMVDAADSAEVDVAIGARGLTGRAYRGHVFWDTDAFVLPVLACVAPRGARRALDYRWLRLEQARLRARSEGRAGARFPWESAASGDEVTPTTGTDLHGDEVPIRTGELELHITADIAWAVGSYVDWTGDDRYHAGHGLDLLIETARYWASRIELDGDGSGHIRHVIGPDEYHEDVDDNMFTNVMVRHNLELAGSAADRFSGTDRDEIRRWAALAEAIVGPQAATGVYEQFHGFSDLTPMSAREVGTPPLSADVLLGREVVQASQIIKQPDVLMAYHLVPHLLDADGFAANLDFYDRRTAHGSSLSPAISASLLFRAGRWDEAMRLFELAAFLDLDDLTGTTAGGLHTATMAGVWQAITVGLLGIRVNGHALTCDPMVPPQLGPVAHRFVYRDTLVDVNVDDDRARVETSAAIALDLQGDVRTARRHDLFRTNEGWEHR